MKQVSVILLSLVFLLISARDWVDVAYYELNKEYITDVFCINKSKPEMLCSGKCYLGDQLEQNQQDEEQMPNSTVDKSVFVLYPPQVAGLPLSEWSTPVPRIKNNLEYTESFHDHTWYNRLFRPPPFA